MEKLKTNPVKCTHAVYRAGGKTDEVTECMFHGVISTDGDFIKCLFEEDGNYYDAEFFKEDIIFTENQTGEPK